MSHMGNIIVGETSLSAPELQAYLKNPERVWVTHLSLSPYLLKTFDLLGLNPEFETILYIPEGESHKTLATWENLLAELLDHRMSREGLLIAFGGGVVSDVVGFASACYVRGISYITFPTTLLAMVDASVGGKTGVNHPRGKNLIGAFYPPAHVFIYPPYLQTLSLREFRSGLAEVVKYGFILDKSFLIQLSEWIPAIRARDVKTLTHVITRCCELKAQVVQQDPKEGGMRRILNFGHTLGHALEKAAGYGELLHGEAVSIGMCYALRLSVRSMGLSKEDAEWGIILLEQLGLPTEIPSHLSLDAIFDAMRVDKKRSHAGFRFILLEQLGVSREWVCEALPGVLF